jgi:hypothetical protein
VGFCKEEALKILPSIQIKTPNLTIPSIIVNSFSKTIEILLFHLRTPGHLQELDQPLEGFRIIMDSHHLIRHKVLSRDILLPRII